MKHDNTSSLNSLLNNEELPWFFSSVLDLSGDFKN